MGSFNIRINTTIIKFSAPISLPLSKEREIYAGVYVMYDEFDNVLYVGKSKDLAARYKGHRRDAPFFSQIERVVLYRHDSAYMRELLETHLINELEPIHNRSKTYFRGSDYAEEIEEIDYEIGELTADIADLKLDRDGIVVGEYSMYDRESAASDRRLISDEIADKKSRIAELRERRHALLMRIV